MNVQQAVTLFAVVVLAILAGTGVYYWAVANNTELGKTLVMLTIPTIAAIAGNAVAQGREKVTLEQPAGFSGAIVYVASENKELVAEVVRKLTQK